MKRILIILFASFSLFAEASQAPIMLCNSNGTLCAPYSNLDSAYGHAVDGDIIYLPAGSFVMPTLSKEITILGVGANVDSSLVYGGATIITNPFNLDANNITLEGLWCLQPITIGNSPGMNVLGVSLRFSRLYSIDHYPSYPYSKLSNCQVIGCFVDQYLSFGLIGNGGSNEALGIQGTNNFVLNSIFSYIQRLDYSLIKNCVVKHTAWNGGFNVVNNTTIENTLVLTPWVFETCTWGKNNIVINCYLYGQIAQQNWCPSIISNNQFISCESNSTYGHPLSIGQNSFEFPVAASANLAQNHPALTAATDGGEIGIHGGLFPWNQHHSVPSNPHMYYKQIPSIINTGTNLPVQIKVRNN